MISINSCDYINESALCTCISTPNGFHAYLIVSNGCLLCARASALLTDFMRT